MAVLIYFLVLHHKPKNKKNMNWYKTLTIEQKINLKALSESICGVRYDFLIRLFGMRQTIELLYQKLKIEYYF